MLLRNLDQESLQEDTPNSNHKIPYRISFRGWAALAPWSSRTVAPAPRQKLSGAGPGKAHIYIYIYIYKRRKSRLGKRAHSGLRTPDRGSLRGENGRIYIYIYIYIYISLSLYIYIYIYISLSLSIYIYIYIYIYISAYSCPEARLRTFCQSTSESLHGPDVGYIEYLHICVHLDSGPTNTTANDDDDTHASCSYTMYFRNMISS